LRKTAEKIEGAGAGIQKTKKKINLTKRALETMKNCPRKRWPQNMGTKRKRKATRGIGKRPTSPDEQLCNLINGKETQGDPQRGKDKHGAWGTEDESGKGGEDGT